MKKHKIISRIFVIFACVAIVMSMTGSVVFGEVNPGISNLDENAVLNVISSILGVATGALGSALSIVVLLIVGVLYLILWLIFYPITAQMPAADSIVFNGIAVFDPNFINPADHSIVGMMKETIQQIYGTGYIVGGAIFVIGAMIIGMKLAITSIATEKAFYKEMIVTWLKGLVLLFTVHIIVAGVFYLNEVIVATLYEKLKIADMQFKTSLYPNNIIGKALGALAAGFATFTGR